MDVYGDGSGGALNVASGTHNLALNTKHQFTTVNVSSGATLSTASTTGSVLYILATDSITINGSINVSNKVVAGNNSWSVVIDGITYTSPGVSAGGTGGSAYNGGSGGIGLNGFGGGGAGGGSQNNRGGHGGTGGTPGGSGGAGRNETNFNANVQFTGNSGGASAGGGGALALWFGTGTSGAGGSAYGNHGANSSSDQDHDGAGGGGAGGIAGKAGVHVVLKAPSITINGTVITSGTSGGNGGNGGHNVNYVGAVAFSGGGGGGGGGGSAGNVYITHSGTYSKPGTITMSRGNFGVSGSSSYSPFAGIYGEAGNNGTLTVSVNTAPTVTLSSPANNAQVATSTPELSFVGTDAQNESIEYQLQVSQSSDFSTNIVDVLSSSDVGFSGTSPYSSGTTTTYTLQNPLSSGAIPYYWRVRAKDPLGSTLWGAWSSRTLISEPNPPTVSSGSSSSITGNSVTLSGTVDDAGGGTITERGFVYSTTIDPTTVNSKSIVSGALGVYSAPITGLSSGTQYYWRSYATNSKSTSYGATQSFTTLPNSPAVSSIYDITFQSASVDATIDDAGSTVTERGIVYSLSTGPNLSSNKIISGSGGGAFTANIIDLTPSTVYYIRAYATNTQGTTYSPEVSFSTSQPPGPPTVITGTLGTIEAVSAQLDGSEVTLNGTQTVTERGVVFSDVSETPTIDDRKVAAATTGLGTFDVTMTGLDPETLHYARAYAVNSLGVGYGEVVSFTTISLFVADEGDGYWTWTPDGSNAVIGRSQATPAYSSANLLLSDLNLEDGETYTLYYSGTETDSGQPYMVLQWYDNLVKTQQVINPNEPYTFLYDKNKLSWAIRLFVTGSTPEADPINAAFNNMYLAKESSFSEFVPFVARGLTEIKLENNWLLDERRESTIQNIFNAIRGVGWSQFNVDTTGLGWLETGDLFTIENGSESNKVIAWNTKLTVDGGLKENLSAEPPEVTETDYKKAGGITKSLKRTQISVDKNEQTIESIVEDVYSVDGVINTKFSEVAQDIESVRTTVQSSGGINLVKNSVMYAFDDVSDVQRENIALDKIVTASGTSGVTPPDVVTDGVIESDEYLTVTDSAEAYVEVDLGQVYEIDTVKVWHYWTDGRTYVSPRTEVSEDGTTWSVVSAPDPYVETSAGHERSFTPVNARYVRDYTNGSSVNTQNNWVEFEIYGVRQFVPSWIVSGVGELTIQSSPESITAGAISGNQFSLSDKTVTQTVMVRKNVDFIAEEEKTYYSLSAKVKKNTVGSAYIKLINRNETLTIDLPDQTEYYWETVSLEGLLPLDDHYDIEIYSDDEAHLQVTDVILAPSETKREWSQANGEAMNTTMAVMDEGVTIRSNRFRNDYTRITALGFEVRKHEAGGERVFGFNGDETNVRKLKADSQISMNPLRTVPINYGTYKGWAFTRTEDE